MSSRSWRGTTRPRSAFFALTLFFALAPRTASAQLVELVSRVGFNYDSVGGEIGTQSISDDGRYVAFTSGATNLVPGQVDFNGNTDVFLYDRQLSTVSLVSHRQGAPLVAAAGSCSNPVISGDGRFVAFVSDAEDLVPGFVDTKPDFFTDVFLYEGATGVVTLASHTLTSPVHATSGTGAYGPAVSNDDVNGVFVAFVTDSVGMQAAIPDTNGTEDVFVYRHDLGTVVLASHSGGVAAGNGASGAPSISDDGGMVAFQSLATDFIPIDINNAMDVFVFNRLGNFVVPVSHDFSTIQAGNAWSGGPVISGDGTRVAFASYATDLLPGPFVDSNGPTEQDAFGWTGGFTVLLSGAGSSPSVGGDAWSSPSGISDDGQTVVFRSLASDLTGGSDTNGTVDVFLYAYGGGGISLVSHADGLPDAANGTSDLPTISADGSRVAYRSEADDLVAGSNTFGQRNIYVYNRGGDTNSLVSHVPGDPLQAGDLDSWIGAVSNGGYVAVQSEATDLVSQLIYEATNVYLYPAGGGDLSLVSDAATASSTPVAESYADVRSMSADGRFVVFTSEAPNVVPGPDDQNFDSDVFIFDRTMGTVRLVSHTWDSTTTTGDSFSGNPRISRTGTHVAFESYAIDLVNGFDDSSWGGEANLYLYDVATEAVTLVSHAAGTPLVPADGFSGEAVLSDDGRYVAFESAATDLVPGFTDGNSGSDIFRYDRLGPTTVLVSRTAASPTTSPSSDSFNCRISGAGDRVTFETASPAAELVAGAVDTNGSEDVFLFEDPLVQLVSHNYMSLLEAADGASTDGEISRSGAAVAFVSDADDVTSGIDANAGGTDVFLHENTVFFSTLVSHTFGDPNNSANGGSWGPSISDDGQHVAYESLATDLVWGFVEGNAGGETDVYLYWGLTGNAVLASHASDDESRGGNLGSYGARLSGDASRLAFTSDATDLAAGTDVNSNLAGPAFARPDVFLFDRVTGSLSVASHPTSSLVDTANGPSWGDDISTSGFFVAFSSPANDLVADDFNVFPGEIPPVPSSGDVFLHTLSCSAVTLLPATPNGDNRIDLTWSSPTPQTYTILRSLSSGGPYSQIGATDGTTFADLSAGGGVTYYYVIGSACGISNERSTATTGTCGDAPEQTGPPTASSGGGVCTVQLDWPAAVAPCGGTVSYSVYRGTDPAFVPDRTSRIVTNATSPYFDFFSVLPDTTYYYIVRATSLTTGAEDPNTDRIWITPTGCTAAEPATVQFFNVRSYDGENTLEWVNPGGGYQDTQIFFTDDGSEPFCSTGTPVPGSPFAGTAGTRDRAVHGGLANGTLYRYAACVHDGLNLSVFERQSLGRPDDATGSVKWGYTTDATTLATAGVAPNRGYFAVSNDMVLHGLTPGAATGGLWPLGPPVWYPVQVGTVQDRPTVLYLSSTTVKGADMVALVGSQDGHVYAIDAETGQLLWTSPLLGTIQASPSVMLTELGGAYDLVVVSTRDVGDNTFYGLNLSDGTIAWSFDNGGGIGIISGQAQVDYGASRVYFTSHLGGSGSSVWCLEFTDSTVTPIWQKGLADGIGDVEAGPVRAFADRLYVGTVSGEVFALNTADGSPFWPAPWSTGDTFVKGYVWPDILTGRVYFSTTNAVHAIKDNNTSVAAFWTAPVAIASPSPPILWNGRVFVGGANNRVFSIDATIPNPPLPLERIVGDPATPTTVGAPTLDTTNGLLLFGTESGVIYSVDVFP